MEKDLKVCLSCNQLVPVDYFTEQYNGIAFAQMCFDCAQECNAENNDDEMW